MPYNYSWLNFLGILVFVDLKTVEVAHFSSAGGVLVMKWSFLKG